MLLMSLVFCSVFFEILFSLFVGNIDEYYQNECHCLKFANGQLCAWHRRLNVVAKACRNVMLSALFDKDGALYPIGSILIINKNLFFRNGKYFVVVI